MPSGSRCTHIFPFGVAALAVACASPAPSDEPAPLSDMIGVEGAVDYTIEAGQSFVIDRSYRVGQLTVRGKLFCQQGNKTPIVITASSIRVVGAGALFECGNESRRYDGNITFLLHDDGGAHAGHAHAGASGTLSVEGGGTLRWFGDRTDAFGWQRIASEVQAGGTVVRLEHPVGWRQGDVVALGPTGFDFAAAESRTVAAVEDGGLAVRVTEPFKHAHGAFVKEYREGARRGLLDERAEIANLTRNIVVSAAPDPALEATKRGASLVVRAGGRAFVDGVELTRGGKLGVLGAYPFHWHLAGDVPGQFLRNSSIHHTFQRCVTIHGTNRAEVTNNVCFDHLGHGFFFEQGNEVKNVMLHNLGMLSRRVERGKGLLDSDMRSDQSTRFSAPSTFWVTNPDNDVRANVASGSEGSGFWMSFSQGLRCGTAGDPNACEGPGPEPNVVPARADTLAFSSNVAHSTVVGITWDGAEDGELSDITPTNPRARRTVSSHYHHGEVAPVFDSLQVWKNVASGIYFRGNPARFTRLLAADNGRSLFFAYEQSVDEGLIVGTSEGVTRQDVDYARSLPPDVRLTYFGGQLIYDGPFFLKNVHFADFQERFPGLPAGPIVNIGGANRWVNRVEHVTFAGEAKSRVTLYGEQGWADTPWTTAVRDDGSITGAPGLIVPDHPLNFSAGECRSLPPVAADRGLLCQYDVGVMTFWPSKFKQPAYDAVHVPIQFERIEQATGATLASDKLAPQQLTNKAAMIMGSRYRYRLSLSQPDAVPERVAWIWVPEKSGLSPILEIDGVAAARCRPGRAGREAPSLDALKGATQTAYRYENGNLFMRVAPGDDSLVCQ